jgi:hypothetical protein
VLTICPGCAEIHEGPCEHCDECWCDLRREIARERSSRVARLISPTPTQRESLARVLEGMEADDLRDVVMRMLQYLPPIERSALIEVAAETAGIEWRRKCR